MFRYNGVDVENTFAEMFPMWVGRVLITGERGLGTSIAAVALALFHAFSMHR